MRRDNAAWIPLLLFLAGASLVLAGLLELPAAIFHPAAAGLGLAVLLLTLKDPGRPDEWPGAGELPPL